MKKTPLKSSRVTPLKKEVLDVFKKHKILTVAELSSQLQKRNLNPNKTTLYRQIKTLIADQMLNEVLIDNNSLYYEIATNHHHHFNCNHCKKVICLTNTALDKVENSIHKLIQSLQKKGHVTTNHHFSLNGLCNDCTKTN